MTTYSKSSKILNIFLFLFSNKIIVIRDGINKVLMRLANRDVPVQTSFSETV